MTPDRQAHAQSVANAIGDVITLRKRGLAAENLTSAVLSAASEFLKILMSPDDAAPSHMPGRAWAVVRGHEMRYAEGTPERAALAELRKNLQGI